MLENDNLPTTKNQKHATRHDTLKKNDNFLKKTFYATVRAAEARLSLEIHHNTFETIAQTDSNKRPIQQNDNTTKASTTTTATTTKTNT